MEINKELIKLVMKELVGATDIAKMLNWDIRKVSAYKDRASFPSPIGEIGARPVWWRREIEEYKKRADQK